MHPGALYQAFSLRDDRLTLHLPGGSGICDQRYERASTTSSEDASGAMPQPPPAGAAHR
jgi:hypothetical protein